MYKFHTEVVCTKFVDSPIDIDDIVNKKEDDKLIVYHDIEFIGNGFKV